MNQGKSKNGEISEPDLGIREDKEVSLDVTITSEPYKDIKEEIEE